MNGWTAAQTLTAPLRLCTRNQSAKEYKDDVLAVARPQALLSADGRSQALPISAPAHIQTARLRARLGATGESKPKLRAPCWHLHERAAPRRSQAPSGAPKRSQALPSVLRRFQSAPPLTPLRLCARYRNPEFMNGWTDA